MRGAAQGKDVSIDLLSQLAQELKSVEAIGTVEEAVRAADRHVFEAAGVVENFCPRLDAPAWASTRALLALHAEVRALRLGSQ